MVHVLETTLVAQLTGAGTANRTDERFGINATDLGILWDGGDGRIYVMFGDTYGHGWGGDGAGPPEADWRCNTLAFSSTRDLSAGMTLDDVVRRPDGLAAQVLPGARWGTEATIIPNAGIAVDGKQYVQYMSVQSWGAPGQWDTGHAGIAVSADGGQSWDKPRKARWKNRTGEHPFQIGSFARQDDHVYLFGTTNGRFGPAYLARTEPAGLLDANAYRYWTGTDWSRDEFAAAPVLPGPVGELSVEYSPRLGRWLAMHLDEHRAAIVLRTAEQLTGPWSEGEVVVSGQDWPALYGGYLHPWSVASPDGDELYFLLSQWGPYNVFLLRTRVS